MSVKLIITAIIRIITVVKTIIIMIPVAANL